jgi:hypothetical protein
MHLPEEVKTVEPLALLKLSLPSKLRRSWFQIEYFPSTSVFPCE